MLSDSNPRSSARATAARTTWSLLNRVRRAGADNRIALGAFLEMILIIANIGTAVVLFPILKRQNERLALGYVTARIVESAFIAVGILSLLAVVTLRQDVGATGAGSLVMV